MTSSSSIVLSSTLNPFVLRNGQQAYTLKELANLCERFSDDALYHLIQGHFEPWIVYIGKADLAFATKSIREENTSDISKLNKFIDLCISERLAPISPFIFRNGQEAYTLRDLLRMCEIFSEDAIYHLTYGHFEPWLEYIGKPDLALAAKRIGEENTSSILKLDRFIKICALKKFSFLLVGRTGVGKSSTVNTLLGKEIAKVGHWEPMTTNVQSYTVDLYGTECTVFDTPGLCDDLEDIGNDIKYLNLMQASIPQIDCMWFVTILNDRRVRSDEKTGIKLISQRLGNDIWKNSLIVFTHADLFGSGIDFLKALSERTRLIRNEIAIYAGEKVANNIPSVAVSNFTSITPDGQNWLGEIYTQTFLRISEKGATPFLLATLKRVRFQDQQQLHTKEHNHNTTSGDIPSHPSNKSTKTPLDTDTTTVSATTKKIGSKSRISSGTPRDASSASLHADSNFSASNQEESTQLPIRQSQAQLSQRDPYVTQPLTDQYDSTGNSSDNQFTERPIELSNKQLSQIKGRISSNPLIVSALEEAGRVIGNVVGGITGAIITTVATAVSRFISWIFKK